MIFGTPLLICISFVTYKKHELGVRTHTSQDTMLKTLVAAALVAMVTADGIPDFVAPGNCAKVANQDNLDLRRVSCFTIYYL